MLKASWIHTPCSRFKPPPHRQRQHSDWHFTYLTACLTVRTASMVYCLDKLWKEDNWEHQRINTTNKEGLLWREAKGSTSKCYIFSPCSTTFHPRGLPAPADVCYSPATSASGGRNVPFPRHPSAPKGRKSGTDCGRAEHVDKWRHGKVTHDNKHHPAIHFCL